MKVRSFGHVSRGRWTSGLGEDAKGVWVTWGRWWRPGASRPGRFCAPNGGR